MRRSTPRDFWKRVVQSNSDCHEWTGSRNNAGYGTVAYQGRKTLAHRLAYELATGVHPGGLCVCHTCDNRLCCRPAHLFLGTAQDNTSDRDKKGRGVAGPSMPGETNSFAKLTNAQAIDIFHSTESSSVVAAKYGVKATTVCAIRAGTRWSKVTGGRHAR
jgi:hypothetical protein